LPHLAAGGARWCVFSLKRPPGIWGAALTIESKEGRMTVFDIGTLNALGARLFDHADSITNPARHDREVDCRLAAPCLREHGYPSIPGG
jgi:hypothetical protein